MNKYELVVICYPTLSKQERDDLLKSVEQVFKDNILEKDDMGMMKLAYKTSKQSEATIISYYLQVEPQEIDVKKKQLIYLKGIRKFFVFKMGLKEKFHTYADLEKIYKEKFEALQTKSLKAVR